MITRNFLSAVAFNKGVPMTSTAAMAFGEYDMPERNRRAAKTIENYAKAHAAADAGIGLFGFLPIPGAATASIAGALALQIPVFKCLASDLSRIYLAPGTDGTVDTIVAQHVALGSALELGSTILVDHFGAAFIQEIATDLLSEIGIGFGVSLVPFLGGFISMGLDVAIAMTMTWRVGTMVSLYYQNGGCWVGGSRRETYNRAKDYAGGLSPRNQDRVNLNDISQREPSVNEHQVGQLLKFVRALFEVDPNVTDERILAILRERKLPDSLAREVIRRARAKM